MADAGPAGASDEARAGGGSSVRSELVFLGAAIVAAGGVLAYLHFAHRVALDEATLALAIACAVLIYALRSLYAVVAALARPDVDLLLARDAESMGTVAELRADRKRVLRAIKELDFDFDMGKLNPADYKEIRDRYRLRAVELKREIDGASAVHPEVERVLAHLGRDRGCPSCGKQTELDARFCRSCGAQLDGGPQGVDEAGGTADVESQSGESVEAAGRDQPVVAARGES
jgi:hypothetical protein